MTLTALTAVALTAMAFSAHPGTVHPATTPTIKAPTTPTIKAPTTPTIKAPTTATAGTPVAITGTGPDVYDRGAISFGDGDFQQTGLHTFKCAPASAPKCRTLKVTHTYTQPGTYTITLGNIATNAILATRTIIVR